MKMKLKEINKHFAELAGLGKKVFPSRLGFAISCNLESFQAELERAEKIRTKLCETYAQKDKNGNAVKVDSVVNNRKTQEYKMSDEERNAFSEEYSQFMETEVEVEIRKAKMEDIERCEKAERYDIPNVAELVALSFMLEE